MNHTLRNFYFYFPFSYFIYLLREQAHCSLPMCGSQEGSKSYIRDFQCQRDSGETRLTCLGVTVALPREMRHWKYERAQGGAITEEYAEDTVTYTPKIYPAHTLHASATKLGRRAFLVFRRGLYPLRQPLDNMLLEQVTWVKTWLLLLGERCSKYNSQHLILSHRLLRKNIQNVGITI